MPQSQAQQDYLKSTLQQSKTLTDDQRQGIWDTFTQSTDQKDFVNRVNALGYMNDDAKQSLYELRYKPEKWIDAQGNPIKQNAPSQATAGATSVSTGNGSSPTADPATRFIQSFASNVGAPPKASDIVTGPAYAVQHPLDAASLMYGAIKQSQRDTIASGQARVAAGHPIQGYYQEALGHIPVFGPMLSQAGEQLENKDIAGGLGSTAGIAAGLLMGKLVPEDSVHPAIRQAIDNQTAKAPVVGPGGDVRSVIAPKPTMQAAATAFESGTTKDFGTVSNKLGPQTRPGAEEVVAPKPSNVSSTSGTTEPQAAKTPVQTPISVAPEPVQSNTESLSAPQQTAAKAVERQMESVQATSTTPLEEPLRRIVEQAGGKYRGLDSMGLVHFDAPPDRVGGRQGVTISVDARKMSPDFVQVQFDRKAVEFAPATVPGASPLSSLTSSSLQSSVPPDPMQSIRDRVAVAQTPEQLAALRDEANATADAHANRAQTLRQLNDIRIKNEENAQRVIAMKSVGYSAPTQGINPETGEVISAGKQTEVATYGRQILAEAAGKKPQWSIDDAIRRKAPDNVTQPVWDSLLDKIKSGILAKHADILKDISINQDTGMNIEDTDIPARIRDVDRDFRMYGQFPAPDLGARPKLPMVDERGQLLPDRAPLQVPSLKDWNNVFGNKLRKIPDSNEITQAADKLEGLAAAHRDIGNNIDKLIGPTPEVPSGGPVQATVRPDDFINKVSRGTINSQQVEKYRAQIRANGADSLDPVKISYDEQGNITGADGRHRALAAKLEHVDRIPVEMTREIPKPAHDQRGAINPNLLGVKPVVDAMRATGPLVKAMGVSIKEWFGGAKEESTGIDPRLDASRAAQMRDLAGPDAEVSRRQRLISSIFTKLDPFAILQDRPSAIQGWLMRDDPNGRYFRDSNGSVQIGEGPYASARLAQLSIRGETGASRQMYATIEREASKAGLHNETTDYMNLKRYQRAYEVVNEHRNELQNQIQQTQRQLNTSESITDTVHLQDSVKALTKELKDVNDKINNAKIVPNGWTPNQIQMALDKMSDKLGSQKYTQVQSFANRVYDANAKALDMLADTQHNGKNALITPEAYQAYKARGNEYIPSKRILETAAEANKRYYGSSSPLYLRQQNVIHYLEGSEMEMKDPWQASADAHHEIIREFYRNKNLNDILAAMPKMPGTENYFTKVPEGYSARSGEGVVGSYQNGKVQNYAVPSALKDVLDQQSPQMTKNVLTTLNRFTTNLFKTAATVGNPAWIIGKQLPVAAWREGLDITRNAIDERSLKPYAAAGRALAKAAVQSWANGPEFQEFVKTGLTRNSLLGQLYSEYNLAPSELGAKGTGMRVLDTVKSLSNWTTNTVSMAHYTRLLEAGNTPEAARFKTLTRGPLPDYGQLGKGDSAIAAATTFLRADWAHIRSTFAMAGDKDFRGAMAVATFIKLAAMTPAIIHNLQQKDDKGNPLWARISQQDKERNNIVLTGGVDKDGRPNGVRVPKSDMERILYNPVEDVMYKIFDKAYSTGADPQSAKQIIANATSRLIPGNPQFDTTKMTSAWATGKEAIKAGIASTASQAAPLMKAPVELGLNRQVSFGQVKPIVTNDRVQPQYSGYGTSGVSPMMFAAGQKTGFAPQQLEYAAHALLGPGAGYIEKAFNPLFSKDMPRAQGQTGQYMRQDVSEAQQKYTANVQRVQQTYQTYQMLAKSSSPQLSQFEQANRDDIAKGRIASEMQKRLGVIDQFRQAVQTDPTITEEKRSSTLSSIADNRLSMLKAFNTLLDTKPGDRPASTGGVHMGTPSR